MAYVQMCKMQQAICLSRQLPVSVNRRRLVVACRGCEAPAPTVGQDGTTGP